MCELDSELVDCKSQALIDVTVDVTNIVDIFGMVPVRGSR